MTTVDQLQPYTNSVLDKTDFQGAGTRFQGKVRDVYRTDKNIILVASDRYSAFDRNLALIPFKGSVLTRVSNFWFEQTKDIIQNQVIAMPDPYVIVAKKCTPLPIEVVVRGYITGVTGTSLWTLYAGGQRDFGDFVLPDGMMKNQKLETPVITPTTKSDEHDRPLTCKEVVSEGHVPEKLWNEVMEKALAVFVRGQQVARERGLILVDTKYEFGLDENGELTLIDEVHTPDSSRYWQLASYEARIREGKEPENFDKEFLRLWFKEQCDPYNDPVLPEVPDELRLELSYRYIQICEQITGEAFLLENNTPDVARIEASLAPYVS